MRILSIDVGIKHLAFCFIDIIDNNYNIILWKIIDISTTNKCCMCDSPPEYSWDNKMYCKPHAKATNLMIPTKKIINIKQLSLDELVILAKKYKLEECSKPNKRTLTQTIKQKFCTPIKPINANNINLILLGRNIMHHFDILFATQTIDIVLIENQMGKIATRMKTIQGMISQYFIMKHIPSIVFVSSVSKLKHFITKKTTYKERKVAAIDITSKLIKTHQPTWYDTFLSNNKKDDLADCLLQGLSYAYINSLLRNT
jgi:hypothetical protein